MPSLIAIFAILLYFVNNAIDKAFLFNENATQWWHYSGGPDGARTILSVTAGSMITVAGVVFSITIVVLSLASSQFGPRLIKNFMTVKSNQMVLGSFVGTFIYSILVLSNVDATVESRYVPSLSITIAILISLVNLNVLIFFIHNVSESIQAQNIIVRVRHDLDKAIDRIFPEKIGQAENFDSESVNRDYDIPATCDRESCYIKSECSGYLQAVDSNALMQIAVEKNLLIHLGYRPGNFITQGSVLVTVWPGHKVDDNLSQTINAIFIVGPERTLEQDVESAISQLVEIAVRALSPGINDPITAITCIDWLGAALCQLASRKLPSSHRYDREGKLRAICKPFLFEGMVDAAFNMIRQSSQSIAAVSIHLIETIATVAVQTHRKEDRNVLLRHAAMVLHGCIDRLSEQGDREDLKKRYDVVIQACNKKAVSSGI